MTPQQRITIAQAAVAALAEMTATRSITPAYMAAVLTKIIEICIDEDTTRSTGDASLLTSIQQAATSISDEAEARKAAVQTLTTTISTETSERKSAINTLTATISQLALNLSSETAAREAADGDLGELDTTDKSNLVAALNEVNRLLTEFGESISGTLQAEIRRAQAAEQANTTAISTEASRAQGAEQAINSRAGDLSQLETADKSSLVNAINTLAEGFALITTTLLPNTVNAEKQRAMTAEQANAAAISTEKSRAQGAEGFIAEKVELDDKLTAALLALLERRITAIEESVKNGFASLIVDNLSVKVGMKAYMFNGENDDDALVVVRAYAPNFIPKCYAQRWFDTVAKKWYKPTGLTSVNDWVVDN